MATPTPTLTILLISLLSLLATTTLAHKYNRFPPLPASCTGNPTLLKCALDFELALQAAASSQFHISPATISVVLDSVNAARAAGLSIIHVLSTMDATAFLGAHHGINLVNTLNSTIGIAVGELIKATAGLEGEAKLSLAQLQSVGKSLKLASEVGAKLSACAGLKQQGTSMISSNVLLSSLIKQFISLTNLPLKVIANVQAAAKISL